MTDRPLFAIFRLEIRLRRQMKRRPRPGERRRCGSFPASARRAKRGQASGKRTNHRTTVDPTTLVNAARRRLSNIPQLAKTIKSELSNCRHVKIAFSLEKEIKTLASSCTLPNYSLRQVRSIMVSSRVLAPNGQLIPATG
jgi:hypothetical protein